MGQNVSPQKPCESNYNLHERAGGLPLCCFSASNVHHRSKPWAGGLQSTAKVPASPEYNVGLSGPVTHPAGTRLLRSHILLWTAEAAFMPPALPRPRRSDPSAHCRPPQALRRLQALAHAFLCFIGSLRNCCLFLALVFFTGCAHLGSFLS